MKSEMKTEMIHALQFLYVAVPEGIAKDINQKVMGYVTQLENEIEYLEGRLSDETFEKRFGINTRNCSDDE
jgi:hypothetical protein